MTRHRKFSCWLADVRKQMEQPTLEGSHSDLSFLGWGFVTFDDVLQRDIGQVRELVDVLRQVRDGRGVGRGSFEERVMDGLSYVVHNACAELQDGGLVRQPSLAMPASLPAGLRPACEVVLELSAYATDCLGYSRPRDSLAGNRRRYALQLLGEASRVFDMPDVVFAFVRQILKAGRRPAVLGAILFCEAYYEARDIPVPRDVERLLLDFVERTDSRGLAAGALNVLVESGSISELTALDRIDDWKDRNWPWRRAPESSP